MKFENMTGPSDWTLGIVCGFTACCTLISGATLVVCSIKDIKDKVKKNRVRREAAERLSKQCRAAAEQERLNTRDRERRIFKRKI